MGDASFKDYALNTEIGVTVYPHPQVGIVLGYDYRPIWFDSDKLTSGLDRLSQSALPSFTLARRDRMSSRIRCLVFSVLGISTVTCGGSTTAPSASLNLSGTWAGLLGQSGSGAALRMTWTASQDGNNVSGPATLIKPAVNVPATGILSGTLTGSQLSLTYMVQSGSVPGFASCSIAGNGSATVTNSTMSGSLGATFMSCSGSGLEPTGSNRLTLTRQ